MTNLPPARDTFIGRQEDLLRLHSAVDASGRLITVKGTGGVGKTRLCRHFGSTRLALFPGGVWFVGLADSRSAADLLNVVAEALQITLTGSIRHREPSVQIGKSLAQRGRSLLVLDNFEQMQTSASEVVGQWLDLSPETQFIVTSRQPLKLQGEQLFELGKLGEQEGLELFKDRARASGSAWVDTPEHLDGLIALVNDLDCIPLALELAAARAGQFSLETLRRLLDESHKLLTSVRVDRPRRQHSVQDLIQWSWHLLDPWEQEGLLQMSIFKGGFELDTASAVLDLSQWPDAPWAPDIISRLMDHSLVFLRTGVRPRYTMYTSVRAFCDGLAEDIPAHQRSLREAQRRHADHFARLGDHEFLQQLKRHGGASQRQRLHAELGNLLLAIDVSLGAGRFDVAARCALAATNIYEVQGPIWAGLSVLHRVLDAPMEDSYTRSRVFRMLAYLDFLVGDFDSAAEHFESSYADAQAHSDQEPTALHGLHLSSIARVHIARGELQRAADCYATTIEAFTASQDQDGLVSAYVNQGDLQLTRGDFEGARLSTGQALRTAKRRGNRRSESVCLFNFAEIACAEGDPRAAIPLIQDALALANDLGDAKNVCLLLGALGEAHAACEDVDEALSLLQQTLQDYEESMPIRDKVRLRGSLAVLKARTGDGEAAKKLLGNGLAQYGDLPRPSLILLLCKMAEVAILLGDSEEARATLSKAEALSEPLGLLPTAPIRQAIDSAKEHLARSESANARLWVDAECGWFRLGEGETVWLVRRKALHRMFAALVGQHRSAPGSGLSQEAMIAAGWEDEFVSEESGRARVYTAVSTLRKLGLGPLLVRQSDGYKLDPKVLVLTATTAPPLPE